MNGLDEVMDGRMSMEYGEGLALNSIDVRYRKEVGIKSLKLKLT